MKKQIIILTALLLMFSFGFAQKSNLVFFTEQGEPFFVILNGVKQNADARTNVKITDLTAPSYMCKIVFKNSNLGQLDKTIYMNQGTETTYIIKKNNKNKWLIRWMNETAKTSGSSNSDNIYPYLNNEPGTNQVSNNNNIQPNTANVGINVSDPSTGTNLNVNFNTNINPNGLNHNNQTTTTTTTTTSSTNINTGQNHHGNNNFNNNNNNQQTNAVPGYYGPYGCKYPMSQQNFAAAKNSISTKNFENTKLTVAKQVINNNCLTTSQIKEIVKLFDFENTRLDFAKYAYSFVYDKGNYFLLNDAFDFESSIDDLNKYINTIK